MAHANINNANELEELHPSDSDSEEQPIPKKKQITYTGAAKYRSKFKIEWAKCDTLFHTARMGYSFHCDHQGLKDVTDHFDTATCKRLLQTTKNQASIAQLFRPQESSANTAVIRAETIMTNFLIQHNLLLVTADHLGPSFRNIFPDSNIAKRYSSGRTKTRAIVNKAMGPHCCDYLIEYCR